MFASRIDNAFAQLRNEVDGCEKELIKLIQVKKMMSEKSMEISKTNRQLQQTPIAIIGMSSIFPKARNLQEYWTNIIHKVDCIVDVPPSRWNVEDYYDADPKAPDKTYCKRGGFIPDIDFNPMEFGLPPNILELTDISQLLSLVVAKEAMEDAGYGESQQFNRERTGVVLGVALTRQLSTPLFSRLQYPIWQKVLKNSGLSDEDTQKIVEKMKLAYVKWEENSFPGVLANVVAGRIANRLDFGGMNCVVDAACASSLGALSMAVSELTGHRSDMMLTGGVDTDNSVVAYMCFSKTPAVSKSLNVKPFDADSDGMMLGEGIGMLVLKRLEDAEQDNDRIYAVLKGIGTSSDGRYKSIYAPRPEGQVRALRRAYEDAGFSPESVGLIEAHGTGTMAGDPTEFTALKEFFGENAFRRQHIALGSVKSQIGHTKAAAGAASLIKTALALHHKILLPTINITKPNPKLNIETTPFYLNTETRPWIRAEGEAKRRAGVSSFGFGGTNYHIVLEEYESEHNQAYRLHSTAQSLLMFAPTPVQLLARCEDILGKLQSDAGNRHYTELIDECKSLEIPVTSARVGFVADSLSEACKLLQISIDLLTNRAEAESWDHPQGIYYCKLGIDPKGKVVALFSGQGSQYLEMGRELVMNFPCLRQLYGHVDSLLLKDGLKPISEAVYPAPEFEPDKKNAQVEVLQRTEYAQPAIGVFSVGLYKIMQQAGFKPDFVAGHSFGELTALWAAEVLSDEDYFFLSKARGQAMATPDDPNFDAGAMLAVKGEVGKVEEVVKSFPEVTIANFNSNHEVVLAGAKSEIAKVRHILNEQGYSAVFLPVSAAFHTPLVGHAQKPFAQAVEAVTFRSANIPVYTNVTGNQYPTEPQAIQKILKAHLINFVLFKHEIENISADGGYFFIEFGPRNILTNLVKGILGDKPHLAVALNASRKKNSDRQLREAVVKLRVAGLPLKNLDPYQVEHKTTEAGKNKGLSVRLNGACYVSEQTRMAFEKALQDDHQVKLPANKSETLPVANSIQTTSNLSNVDSPMAKPAAISAQPVLEANGHHVDSAMAKHVAISAQPALETKMQATPEKPLNYQRVLDSLEDTIAQFNQHQGENLQVHGQYLNHQMEYAKTFFQLMQQHNSLLANGKSAHPQAQTKQVVVDSLERSMMQFHAHQSDTLRIHEQYLSHQVEYTKTFYQLIQQQYSTPTNGDFAHQRVVLTEAATAFASATDSLTVPTTQERVAATQDNSVVLLPTVPVAIPNSNPANEPELVLTNGSKPVQEILVGTQTSWAVKEAPTTSATIDFTDFGQSLFAIVSDKTGYPAEMLELEMDMEADLGIDSIKRVEILGAVQELYADMPQANPEELAELRTLGQIVEYLQQQAPDSAEKKIFQDEMDTERACLNHNIQRNLVTLKVLPEPDRLDFTLPEQHICLISDDGSLTTSKLAQSLVERGWKVVILRATNLTRDTLQRQGSSHC